MAGIFFQGIYKWFLQAARRKGLTLKIAGAISVESGLSEFYSVIKNPT